MQVVMVCSTVRMSLSTVKSMGKNGEGGKSHVPSVLLQWLSR